MYKAQPGPFLFLPPVQEGVYEDFWVLPSPYRIGPDLSALRFNPPAVHVA